MDWTKGHVLPDGRREELIVWILEDKADFGTHATDRLIRYVHPCNANTSMRWSVDPIQVQHQRALPCTVRPEERHLLATRNVHVNATERFGAVGISEVKVLKVHPVVITCRFAVVGVRVRMCGREPCVRVTVAVPVAHLRTLAEARQRR
jgi:hypothetical protein